MTSPTAPQLSESEVSEIEARFANRLKIGYLETAIGHMRGGQESITLITVDVPALIRDWRALRQWKTEALPLLTRYDKLAETFNGKLGSSKVANLERGVAALREQLAHLQSKTHFLTCGARIEALESQLAQAIRDRDAAREQRRRLSGDVLGGV